MRELKSNFASQIIEYDCFRQSMGYSNTHFHYLSFFDEFCYDNYPDKTSLSKDLIKGWFADVKTKRPGTLRDSYFTINSFLKYVGAFEYILPNSYLPKKTTAKRPYLLSDEELVAFFHALNNAKWKDCFSGWTLGTMIRLIYSSGIRPNEARNLKNTDVNLIKGTIHIKNSKKDKERIIALSEDMRNLMILYSQKHNLLVHNSELFFSHSDGSAVTQAFLWRTVDRCWKVANPTTKTPTQINPYTFRHQFASTIMMKWLNEGVDILTMIPYLKVHMGHSHFESTVYYIHLLPERLLNAKGVDWEALDAIGKDVTLWENL